MPRRPRLVIAGIPLHVTQRGVNRAAVFIDRQDHRLYHDLLTETLASDGSNVHAYALMSNHVHLFISPTSAGNLARAMRILNQRYVAYFNRRHHRTGTLWESRFRSCLVDSERYALTLYQYIELNPVRAAMVEAPEDYPWSSARANLGLGLDLCVTPHPAYTALGTNIDARIKAYGEWLRSGVTDQDLAEIRIHLIQERALGSPTFQAMVARTLNRPVAVRPRGRPRAQDQQDSNG
jgi:putative transposase